MPASAIFQCPNAWHGTRAHTERRHGAVPGRAPPCRWQVAGREPSRQDSRSTTVTKWSSWDARHTHDGRGRRRRHHRSRNQINCITNAWAALGHDQPDRGPSTWRATVHRATVNHVTVEDRGCATAGAPNAICLVMPPPYGREHKVTLRAICPSVCLSRSLHSVPFVRRRYARVAESNAFDRGQHGIAMAAISGGHNASWRDILFSSFLMSVRVTYVTSPYLT